jgi:CheY-like chemotaxis protein
VIRVTDAILNAPGTRQILIIEDDRDDAFLLKRALREASSLCGFPLSVTHQVNGLDALFTVARGDMMSQLPDILIVDLNMPIMDGEKFLRIMRRELKLSAVPAAVLTTSAEKPIHDAALKAGADAVFVKPNSLAELVDIARAILAIRPRLEAPPYRH